MEGNTRVRHLVHIRLGILRAQRVAPNATQKFAGGWELRQPDNLQQALDQAFNHENLERNMEPLKFDNNWISEFI